ncbi:MAG TPA: putative porin [Candidatus Methylacidiphilales bacterium]|nr:putative porin [Candidatus Methylacidiphilales bacterium]
MIFANPDRGCVHQLAPRPAVAGYPFITTAVLFVILTLTARADQPALASTEPPAAGLASDLSVPGPTLDTRPLDNPSTGRVVSPDSALTTQTNAVAVPADPLPQDNALASNQTPDLNTPGSIAQTVPPVVPSPSISAVTDGPGTPAPGLVASTDVAVNNAAPMASVPSKTSAAAPAPAPTTNATINLINLMVKRNLISRDDADGLIREAQQEADNARATQATTQATAEQALTIQQTKPAAAPAPQAQANPGGDDEMRISYVPDIVKKQIADQVTQNVMQETREEHLADSIAASQVPEWVKRLHLTGDIRLRFEGDYFPSGNDQNGNFINFNSINNSSAGLNVSKSAPNPVPVPQYNVNAERDRFRLRMRIGAGIDLGSNFTAGVRVATGSDDNPTTENQTLGGASGQGGYFAKYQVWLDRAFLRYEYGGTPEEDASLTIGRFDNPWYGTTMVWANDLAFDGIVAQGSYEVTPGVTPFLTGGAFPVFNTDFNFSTNNTTKFDSEDKYLFAVQGGLKWQISKDVKFTGAGAYYDFEDINGKVSDPILAQDAAGDVTGNTDDSRPSFAQNGNTYIALRDYEGPAAGGPSLYQYYGLASKFQVVSIFAQLDYSHFDPFHLSVTGEFIDNVGFDRNDIINGGPDTNPGPQNNSYTAGNPNSFYGGNIGYMIHMDAGKVALEELWDWNVRLSYRYVQTDATVDAFTDSDFGAPLYGTNLKGFTVEGNLALSKRVWLGLRFLSADQVAGPTFHSDVVQFDVNAKF